ncbi:MAG: N-acetyltransferase family protein [Actinomycetota bacterium]|nr:N-acetyltransferase family protein [Actinomycetota bacterium]
MSVRLRQAVSADLPRVTAIYNFYIRHGHATFDDVEVRPEDRRTWFETFDADEPYLLLVAEIDGTVAGYAASSRYRPHPAFAATVESSVYVDHQARGLGLGKRLYDELLALLTEREVHSVLAAVALPNEASIALHLSRGFREVGTFTEYAAKDGQLISSTWFEKLLRRRR